MVPSRLEFESPLPSFEWPEGPTLAQRPPYRICASTTACGGGPICGTTSRPPEGLHLHAAHLAIGAVDAANHLVERLPLAFDIPWRRDEHAKHPEALGSAAHGISHRIPDSQRRCPRFVERGAPSRSRRHLAPAANEYSNGAPPSQQACSHCRHAHRRRTHEEILPAADERVKRRTRRLNRSDPRVGRLAHLAVLIEDVLGRRPRRTGRPVRRKPQVPVHTVHDVRVFDERDGEAGPPRPFCCPARRSAGVHIVEQLNIARRTGRTIPFGPLRPEPTAHPGARLPATKEGDGLSAIALDSGSGFGITPYPPA